MTPEERISFLDFEIKKAQIDLVKAESCLSKMRDLRQEEAIKFSLIDTNMSFLKDKPTIISIKEYSTINKNKKKATSDLKLMDEEIARLEGAVLAHKKNCTKMINERNALLKQTKKGEILEFKRN